jgi:Fe(3+) dicitrate transport protein
MSRLLFSSLLLLLSPSLLFSQEMEVSGKIRNGNDESGIPFAVILVGEKPAAYSNENGDFSFTLQLQKSERVSIHVLGYDTWTKELINNDQHKIDLGIISLKPTSVQIPEIVISAQSNSFKCGFSGSNYIITQVSLRRIQPISTEEILKQSPGINISGDMGLSNRLNVGIRGAYPRRSAQILLMEDGTPIAPAPYLAPEAYYNPPSERMDEIEVIKGADMLMFGSNTSFGAINYITRKPPITPQLRLQLTTGQRNYQSQYLSYGGTWKNVGAEIQVLNKSFNGFVDNSGFSIFNTTAKLYTELTPRSSLYLKLNYHKENAKATYSGITPYTFTTDATQNPFDSDDLNTSRMAADLIFTTQPLDALVLSTKIYAHQFNRDWWRQESALIKVSDAASYLGESIFADRYSYLESNNPGSDDFVRVGKLINGNESTKARNRGFQVAGVQQTVKYKWKEGKLDNNSEIQIRIHTEKFKNQEFTADSSRFARSGKLVLEEVYNLTSFSAAIKHTASWKRFTASPILRIEWIEMSQLNLLSTSLLTNNDGTKDFGKIKNEFSQVIPSISLAYQLNESSTSQVFGGLYRGYLSPATDVGFLLVDDGDVSVPASTESANMKPQISNNMELGIRGSLINDKVNGGLTAFSNTIFNYYAAGRSTAFESLGKVNISGIEIQAQLNIHSFLKWREHHITAGVSTSFMQSEILAGKINDSDLLKAKHNNESKAEIIDMINSDRGAYDIFFAGTSGDSLITRNLTAADFSSIKTLHMNYDDGLLASKEVPYLPTQIWNFSLTYEWKGFAVSANLNKVAAQFTDYMNLETETNDGALGKLDSFRTIDLTCAYEFKLKSRQQTKMSLFLSGKNITDEVYKASRLHRVSSGIMPGGFRQLNAGIKITI